MTSQQPRGGSATDAPIRRCAIAIFVFLVSMAASVLFHNIFRQLEFQLLNFERFRCAQLRKFLFQLLYLSGFRCLQLCMSISTGHLAAILESPQQPVFLDLLLHNYVLEFHNPTGFWCQRSCLMGRTKLISWRKANRCTMFTKMAGAIATGVLASTRTSDW